MSFGGPPVGSPFGGQSATATSAAAGLPFAGMPSELRERAEEILAEEPEHIVPPVEFSPIGTEQRFTLRSFLWPHRRALLAALLLVVVETIAFQAGPLLTQVAIDEAIVPRRLGVLWMVGGVYLAAILTNAVASRVRIAFTGRLGERLMYQLRLRVFSHLQRLSIGFFTTERSGRLLTRMTSDIEALAALFQDGLVNLAVQGLTVVVITVVLFTMQPALAAITLIFIIPAMLALTWWFRSVSDRSYGAVRDRIAEVLSDLSESLSGIRVIVASNRRSHNVIEHANLVGDYRVANVAASRVGAVYGPVSEAIGVVGQVALLLVGGAMVLDGQLTVGELFAFLLYLTALFAPIQQLVQLYNAYQQGRAAILKLSELLETAPAAGQAADAVALPPHRWRHRVAKRHLWL